MLLALSAVALLLQACASYSPSTYGPIRSDDYYAENPEYQGAYGDPYGYAPDVDFGIGASYYPWYSFDYHYLGPLYYRPPYWADSRYFMGYRRGYPPNLWSYHDFYTSFYYPYAAFAWYDPWFGWPRYGFGANFYWPDIYWAHRGPGSSTQPVTPDDKNDYKYGNSRYDSRGVYGDAFKDPRDRGGPGPANRGSYSAVPSPEAVTQPLPSSMRPITSAPRTVAVQPRATSPRPSSQPVARPASRPAPAPSRRSGAKPPSNNSGRKPPQRHEN